MIGNLSRPADRAEIDRVVLADLLLPVFRHHLAVLFVILPAGEIEMIEMNADAVFFRRHFKHPEPLRYHLLADPVAGNDRDPVLLFSATHREIPWTAEYGW